MNDITVAIADDHSLFREGIRMILAGMEGITLTVEASDGKTLLDQLEATAVDIVLLDMEMKELSGVETMKRISRLPHPPRVIVLSMHTDPRMMSYVMELGASSYLQKDVKKEELETALRTVHSQGTYINALLSQSLLTSLKNKSRVTAGGGLSAREKEVLVLICQELTTKEIAEKLFISERTVEGHRQNLCSKLGVKNTAGLVRKAIDMNLAGV